MENTIKIDTCVILCGGKSSRMHFNKVILPFGNSSLIAYQVMKLSKIFKNIAISLKESNKDEILNILHNDMKKNNMDLDYIKIILEDEKYFTPLFGIVNSFVSLDKSRIFFIPVDCPFIKMQTITTLINKVGNYDILYARDSIKSHPLIAIWHENTKVKILDSLQNNKFKILEFFSKCNAKSFFFDSNEFLNINTQKDYKNALLLLKNKCL